MCRLCGIYQHAVFDKRRRESVIETQPNAGNRSAESGLARFGLGLANWSERWFPDPLVFALLGIVFVFLTGLCLQNPPGSWRFRA